MSGIAGVVGVGGVGVHGVGGSDNATRSSVGETGTVLSRRYSWGTLSPERRLRVVDKPGGLNGSESLPSETGATLWGRRIDDADEEGWCDETEDTELDATDNELGWWCAKIEPWRFNTLEVVFPRGSIAKDLSFSKRYGVVPRTAPSFLVERIRRKRCCELSILVVGGR